MTYFQMRGLAVIATPTGAVGQGELLAVGVVVIRRPNRDRLGSASQAAGVKVNDARSSVTSAEGPVMVTVTAEVGIDWSATVYVPAGPPSSSSSERGDSAGSPSDPCLRPSP